MALKVTIAAFPEAGSIPELHTCEGADISPGIEWSGGPDGALSYALVMDDPDAPAGTWNHWLLWDIPKATRAIAPAYKPGQLGQSGTNDFGKTGYGGPCPPRGHGPHRYVFHLYALDVATLNLRAGARRADLDRALKGHIRTEASYMGRYERK